MPTCVAFLRAINVTGRFVKMQTLREAFCSLGHADARTYINSGNVIFTTRQRNTATLTRELEDGLEPLLGFRTEAFVRTVDEVKAIAHQATSLRAPVPPPGEVNVCFLPEPATTAQQEAIAQLRSPIDDFVMGEREIYWLCLTRQSDSRFSNATLERRLKLRSTLRRARMLEGLAAEL